MLFWDKIWDKITQNFIKLLACWYLQRRWIRIILPGITKQDNALQEKGMRWWEI